MRWLRIALIAFLAALLAVRWPARLTTDGVTASWLLLPAILAGLRATTGRAVLLAWGFGLLADSLSIEPFGVSAFLYGAAALSVARLREHLFADHLATQALVAGLLTLAVHTALLVRLEIAEPDLSFSGRLPALLLLSVLTGAVFPILAGIDRRAGLLSGFRAEERRV